jgi:type I restriction enzyme S subunit
MAITVQNVKIEPGYKQTEVGVIPEDWEVKKLGEVCNYQNGTSLEKYFNGSQGLNVISIGNYSVNGKYIDNNSYIDWKYYRKIKKFILRNNELSMVLNDKTSIGTIIGRVLLIKENNKYVFNQRSMRLVPYENISSIYLYYVINSDLLHNKIVSLAKPGTQIYVNTGDVTGLDIPVPKSLEEQTAIATVLSDTDSLIEILDKLIAKKRDIKQATMQQLLTGKTRLSGFGGEWVVKKLGEIAYINMGQSPDSKNYNVKGIGMTLIQGNADIENRKSISRVWTTQISKTCNEGDLIMTVRAPLGSIGIATKESCLGRGVCSLKCISDDSHFIFHSMVFLEGKWKTFGQGSTFTSANSSQIAEFPLSIPDSIEEQQAIATILSDMDAEIAALEEKCDKTRALKQGMMQDLLTGKTRLI